MKIDRREALRLMAAGTTALGFPTIFGASALAAQPDLTVITGADPQANVRAAINNLGGMKRFISKGDIVVIKPNMGFGNAPLRTTTTEPKVVRTLAEMALNAGAKRILIFDNPCHKPNIVLDICGIKKEVSGLQDTFAYIIRGKKMFAEVNIPKGVALKKQKVARDILEADKIINVPVAKSHSGAKISFGMKGWMGVVKERVYWHTAVNLHQAIADISTLIKPDLTVLDATRALLTKGPGGPGKVANLQTIVAGIDPVAVDAYGVTMAPWGNTGLRIDQVPHIIKAAQLGVGTHDLKKLNILKKTI